MANIIRIKRSTTTATPTSLSQGELAYSESSDNLFIGTASSSLEKIGGNADVVKLATVETNADVTDTANATSAGALMDSELAGIAAIKATTGTFLTADQTKLDTIATGAEVNVQANFSAGSGDAQILNVPDPVITLAGDLSGNVTLTNLANGTLTATVTHDASGVTSAKITNWDAAHSWYSTMTAAGEAGVIDTVTEIVAAFENHAAGLNLITELDAKLTASSTLDGGSF
jgi:hypothetical protein